MIVTRCENLATSSGVQSAPVTPESLLGLSVRDVNDLADARDDVRPTADKLVDFTYLVALG